MQKIDFRKKQNKQILHDPKIEYIIRSLFR